MDYAFFIAVIIAVIFIRCLVVYSDVLKFFMTGNDNGFKFSECFTLWKLVRLTNIDEPVSLFLSVPALNRAISSLISDSRRHGIENSDRIQNFLTKLYKFRTDLNLRHENSRGLDSTKYLSKGQRLRIIFSGHKGIFTSEILNNGYEMVIKLPVQNNIATVPCDDWLNQEISVYLWRKGDAPYVFDTKVTNAGVFFGQSVLYLAQTTQLLRTQKRKSVRCECNLTASMYFIKQEIIDFNLVETEPGYKVMLEDISEDGAMIRVGGQGIPNTQIKLQFMLNDVLILMFGVIRAVEYNREMNQSRLHFECVHLEKDMRNAILSFVYNVLPQDEKNVFDAINATEEDRAQDEKSFEDAGNTPEENPEEALDEVEELEEVYKKIGEQTATTGKQEIPVSLEDMEGTEYEDIDVSIPEADTVAETDNPGFN